MLAGLLGVEELKLFPGQDTEVGRAGPSFAHCLSNWEIAVWASAASQDVTRQHCTVERKAVDAQMQPMSSGVSHPAKVLSAH